MIDYEKLGVFYLGRQVPAGATESDPQSPVLLDARDLTTHAVCVGMTGSGKTGLCLALLEEAAIDGIPAIAIDPKGDLGNLLLTFPQLQPAEFRPWIDEDEARRQGISPDELAAKTATTWREGLARWDEDAARVSRLKAASEFAIYTPGATFGRPLSVLRTFTAPSGVTIDDLRERVAGTASGLLALLGIAGDPLRSREHAFLSTLLLSAWTNGRGLELADLVREIADPPITKVGVLDLETFYPARERMELSLAVNNLLASPGFAAWMEGEPLDVQSLLYNPAGKPRISILSIAHLGDAERMFFVSFLLNELVAWMRRQPGTSSLRALLYMDEIFGFFPPTAAPPSKPLMLTLLKQARAFGLGIVLSTQNPVDLDYKGLANAGTWFLGRLQTENDRERMLDGLLGAAGGGLDRRQLSEMIGGLGKRRFLWHSVAAKGPVQFETRWTLSYLRGPLSRPQIQALVGTPPAAADPPSPAMAATVATPAPPVTPAAATGFGSTTVPRSAPRAAAADGARPALPADVPEFFLPAPAPAVTTRYRPHLIGSANVHYVSARQGLDEWQRVTVAVPLTDDLPPNPWDSPGRLDLAEAPGLLKEPTGSATYDALPAIATKAKSYATWSRALSTHLYQSVPFRLWCCPELKQVSKPGESEADFRLRVTQASREARDHGVDKIRAKYASKRQTLVDRIRRAEERIGREQAQLDELKRANTIQIGASVLGALLGGRRRGIGGLSTAARGVSRTQREEGDVVRAAQEVEVLRGQLTTLDAEIEQAMLAVQQGSAPGGPAIELLEVAPRKADTTVDQVALVWVGDA